MRFGLLGRGWVVLSLETTFLVGVGGGVVEWVAGWLEKTGLRLSHLQS